MTKTIYLKMEGEASNHVEQLYHELLKNVDDAKRYGVDISVQRLPNDPIDDLDGIE